ncbi:MAG: hypothetical protein JW987_03980 [Anaerolineaceae bacterium]|nr:hypothetical protein [Anaerolineaceae bacterium]
MKKIIQLSSVLMIAALLASACAPGELPGSEQPTPVPQPMETEKPTEVAMPTPFDAPIEPPEAVLKARALLAQELNVAEAEITIATIEEKEWPDACLGAAVAYEACAAVITPGYRVVLTVDGNSHELRTNMDGSVVRRPKSLPMDQTNGGGDTQSKDAVAKLAELAGLPIESIRLVNSQPMDWPNGCLGAAERGETCTEAIVPGYKFDLECEGRMYFLHTNQDLSQARLGGPQETLAIVKVRQQAAEDKGVGLEEVTLVSSEAVQWNNSCLGVERDGMMCLMVITPGYRIKVKVMNTTLEYHTNQSASAVVLFKP